MQGDELILNMKGALDLALNACCQGAETAGHADGVPRRWQRGEKRHVDPQLLLDRDGEKERCVHAGQASHEKNGLTSGPLERGGGRRSSQLEVKW